MPRVSRSPDRHFGEVPEALRAVPGIWGHMLSFISGPRGCIGYRFALIEYAFSALCAYPPPDCVMRAG
jgi:cytochrome P450